MTISHPTKEHLAAYASGTLSEGMSLLVASHNTYCASCRAAVETFELIGASVLMEEAAAQTLSAPSLEGAMALIDGPAPAPITVDDPGTPLPMPIRCEVRSRVDDLAWKFRMPGLYEYPLDGFEGEQVSLLRVKPGTGMMHHTHEGEEATLILSGEMEDHGTVFRRGDVALADHNDDHHPKVVGTDLCYCLIVMSGNVRFTGPVSRALNLFTR